MSHPISSNPLLYLPTSDSMSCDRSTPPIPRRWVSSRDRKISAVTRSSFSLKASNEATLKCKKLNHRLNHPWFKGKLIERLFNKDINTYNNLQSELNKNEKQKVSLTKELNELETTIQACQDQGSERDLSYKIQKKASLTTEILNNTIEIRKICKLLMLPVNASLHIDLDEDEEVATINSEAHRLTSDSSASSQIFSPLRLTSAEPEIGASSLNTHLDTLPSAPAFQVSRHEASTGLQLLTSFPFGMQTFS